MLFNCENGTLDLETRELRPHNRNDYLTKISAIAFDPHATCPTWERFLQEVFGDDQDLTAFVQRAAGYSLTGSVREHCLFFLHGSGSNGKTTLVTTLQKGWGEYATTITSDMLMVARGERHPTEMCDLYGARLAIAAETEEGRRLAEVLVKQMTGGDRLKGRRMREDFWEFLPTHKLWLTGNHKPDVVGTDDAIWDRLPLIEFSQRFPRDDPQTDKDLPSKLKNELSGILNWALQGCVEWQRDGLQKPSAVKDATSEYRREMDILGEFLAECCCLGDQFQTGATRLFERFSRWGGKISQTKFGRALAERGFRSARATSGPDKGRKIWCGVGVVDEDGEP